MIRAVTKETEQKIKKLYFENLEVYLIAERLGLRVGSVYSITSKLPKCGKCKFYSKWKQRSYRGSGACEISKKSVLQRDPGCKFFEERRIE
jgi:hypothetical protein